MVGRISADREEFLDSDGALRAGGLRGLLRETVAALRGHDLALYAAGVTFYAAVALVPSLLVALWGLTLLLGDPRVTQYAERLAGALPTALDAPAGAEALLDAATRLAPTTALIALVPASMYGEGLRRAFARLVPGGEGVGDSGPGASWRGRLRLLPLFAVTPLLVLLVLGVTPLLDELFSSGGAGRTLLGVYLAFLADWLAVSVPLTYVYRVVGPATPSWRAAA